MHHLLRFLALATAASMQQTAHAAYPAASIYPTRPIRMVIGNLCNAAIEGIARLVAGKLAAELGQPIDIDGTPGAAGTLGLAAVARAAPDGYTLLMTSTATMAIAPLLYNRLQAGCRDQAHDADGRRAGAIGAAGRRPRAAHGAGHPCLPRSG